MGLFSSSYFRRKDIHQLIGEMNDGERLHRRLGPLALTGLGIGATIGTRPLRSDRLRRQRVSPARR